MAPLAAPRTPRRSWTQVGTTFGLAAGAAEGSPEQVYVFSADEDPDRPIVVEGWVGYGVDSRLNLTRRQAQDLIPLLVAAVLTAPEPTEATS